MVENINRHLHEFGCGEPPTSEHIHSRGTLRLSKCGHLRIAAANCFDTSSPRGCGPVPPRHTCCVLEPTSAMLEATAVQQATAGHASQRPLQSKHVVPRLTSLTKPFPYRTPRVRLTRKQRGKDDHMGCPHASRAV